MDAEGFKNFWNNMTSLTKLDASTATLNLAILGCRLYTSAIFTSIRSSRDRSSRAARRSVRCRCFSGGQATSEYNLVVCAKKSLGGHYAIPTYKRHPKLFIVVIADSLSALLRHLVRKCERCLSANAYRAAQPGQTMVKQGMAKVWQAQQTRMQADGAAKMHIL